MIYLQAPSKESFEEALLACGWAVTVVDTDQSEDVMLNTSNSRTSINLATDTYVLDIIGEIAKDSGTTSSDGDFTFGEKTVLSGWHANLHMINGDIPEILTKFVIPEPNNPVRKFA